MDANKRIIPLVMPKWGLSMKEGKLTAWHVEDGEKIEPGEEILEVETDKIAGAVEAADGGLLRRRVGEVGQVYPVKALLGVIAAGGRARRRDRRLRRRVRGAGGGRGRGGRRARSTSSSRRRAAGCAMPSAAGRGRSDRADPRLRRRSRQLAVQHRRGRRGCGPVYALDLPGHGQSVEGDRRSRGSRRWPMRSSSSSRRWGSTSAHLVGHSLGGAVAAAVALRGGGRVRSLTLISSAGLGRRDQHGLHRRLRRRRVAPRPQAGARRSCSPTRSLVSRQMIDDLLKYKRLDGVAEALRGLAAAMFRDGAPDDGPGRCRSPRPTCRSR